VRIICHMSSLGKKNRAHLKQSCTSAPQHSPCIFISLYNKDQQQCKICYGATTLNLIFILHVSATLRLHQKKKTYQIQSRNYITLLKKQAPRYRSRYIHSLRGRQFGVRKPVGARDFVLRDFKLPPRCK
jgi:hypothetical protein